LNRRDLIHLERACKLLSDTRNFVFRKDGELDERGWVFQEKMLSKRIVSITKDGIFWDCLHHSTSGRRPVGILGDFSPQFRDSDDRSFKFLLFRNSSSSPSISLSYGYLHWRRAVQDYTGRQLTNPGDRLIALDGIASHMSLILRDSCTVGIWNSDPLRCLIWFVDRTDYSTKGKPSIVAQSWSWASVGCSVKYRLWHPQEQDAELKSEKLSGVARVEQITATNDNPLGFSSFRGTITISGPLTQGYILGRLIYIRLPQTEEDS